MLKSTSKLAVLLLALVACGSVSGPPLQAPEPGPPTVAQLVERVYQVHGKCDDGHTFTGSAVVLTAELGSTYLATAQHVTGQGCALTIGDTTPLLRYRVTVVEEDEEHDVALLRLNFELSFDRLEYAHPKLGDPVITAGYPYDKYLNQAKEPSVGFGNILTSYVGYSLMYQYRVSASFLAGHSGGAAFSPDGRLVGITNAGFNVAGWRHTPIDDQYLVSDARYVFDLLNKRAPEVPPESP